MTLSKQDLVDLHYAKCLLESPGLPAKLTNLIGVPLERGFAMLPARWSDTIGDVTARSLERALKFAIGTLDARPATVSNERLHKIAVAATGAGGGAFGLPALALELPVSTTIMLRSIADVARSEGENLRAPETKVACVEVFALGGRTEGDDALDSAYFATRATLARAVTEAASHIAQRGMSSGSAPALVRLVSQVGSRFGVAVSEKAAAQAIPVLGAAGGALVNTLFIDHFQGMARGHFIVRRLERAYDTETIRREYTQLSTTGR
jgi:hypothetical protein